MFQTIRLKPGTPLTMKADDRPTFDEWLSRVDRFLRATRGISLADLPDAPVRRWYDDRVRPSRAANKALRFAFSDGE